MAETDIIDDNQTIPQDDPGELRRQLEALRAERDAAHQRAEEESRRADGLYGQVREASGRIAQSTVAGFHAQEQAAEAQIGALTTELAGLKAQVADLNAEGKFLEAADVQEKIGEATAKRLQAQQAKQYYAGQRETAAATPADPVEAFMANGNFTESEKGWIRRNPRYATDREFQNRVNNAHAEALTKGIQHGSPEYFAHLEAAGHRRQPITPATTQAQPAVPRGTDSDADTGTADEPYSAAAAVVEDPKVDTPRQRSSAAPPSRRTATPGSRDPGRTNTGLTVDQAEAALAMSDLFPVEVQNEGEHAIYAYYQKLYNMPTAQKMRREWAGAA